MLVIFFILCISVFLTITTTYQPLVRDLVEVNYSSSLPLRIESVPRAFVTSLKSG
ncbi:MAG: hypothetical protein IKY79_04635 [Bacteroidales bacterium]|nr:hypothetical protein [Bacteroidales bacterium]